MSSSRVCLGVAPAAEYRRVKSLFDALGLLYPVEFEPLEDNAIPSRIGGLVLLGGGTASAALAVAAHVPALIYAPGTGGEAPCRSKGAEFSDDPCLPSCLRGQRLEDSDVTTFLPLAPRPGDAILGRMDGQPFWVRQGAGQAATELLTIAHPALANGERLVDHFHPGRCVRLLPLLRFVRNAVAAADWDANPMRACFVFDDPNLRRPRFGCLHFGELARHAREHGYHAAIAMVSIDAARARSDAVAIFREHPAELSLLVHGNNHTHLELLDCRSDRERRALLAEALRRVDAFERRHGVTVSRVMEAPHGVIGRAMFPQLAALGYESALTTFAHMLHFEPQEPWPPSFGMDTAEIMPGGFGTIPRILMLPTWRTAVILAAFLGQPMVVAGHHEDAAGGLGLLAEFSALAASFGPVRWLSLEGLCRSNYRTRRDGSLLTVKAYQRRTIVPIPEGVQRLIVERAWMAGDGTERLTLSQAPGRTQSSIVCGRSSPDVEVQGGKMLDLCSHYRQPLDPFGVPPPPRRLWPVARRFLTEVRDRSYPWTHRHPAAARTHGGPPRALPTQPEPRVKYCHET